MKIGLSVIIVFAFFSAFGIKEISFYEILIKYSSLSETEISKKIVKHLNESNSGIDVFIDFGEKAYNNKYLLLSENIFLESLKKKPVKQKKARVHFFLASIYSESNNYSNAFSQIELIENIFGKELNPLISKCERIKAHIYYRLGDYNSAINATITGERNLGKNINIYDYTHLLRERAKAYNAIFNYEEANSLIKKALGVGIHLPDAYEKALLYQTMGYIQTNRHCYSLAINYFEKAKKIFKKSNDKESYSYVCLDIGYLYYFPINDFNKSISYYLEALKSNDSPFLEIQTNDNIGAVYWKKGNFQKALIYYQKALSSGKFFKFSNSNYLTLPHYSLLKFSDYKSTFFIILQDKAICWLDYYKATKTKSHLVRALETYELADKLVDFMRQEHTGTLSKYFWRDKTRSLYENAIETCFLLKDYEKAYYFMEKSRAVMLNDKLNELGAKQKLNDIDQEKEREYQRKIIELNIKIEAETKATEKEKLNSQLFDLQEQQERFVKSLETKYPAYYQLKYNTQIGTLKQMQTYLKTNFKDNNATMVSYFFGDSASYAMVISPTKAEVKQFKYDVAQNQEFVNLLATNQGTKADYARILSMGSVIYQKLIKPLNLPKGHLIISQDGVFMPFEALSSSATSAQYLLKDYAISYTYSGQFLLKKQVETKFWPNQTFVGFAPVEFKNQLNTLKNSDITLGNVAKNYWFSDIFTGKRATKANFLQQAKDHKIVQIFTHAFADSVDTEPKIYFADQALKISELNAEDQFNTQLLVLSACKTGVGKLAKGEGVLSLARGFSMLGIPATITSLWSVEDKNTYQLTELFYKYLNEGQSKDQALQNAKMEFLKLHPNSSPSDWAGMVLVGESLELNNNLRNRIALGALCLISILGVGFYFKRKRQAA